MSRSILRLAMAGALAFVSLAEPAGAQVLMGSLDCFSTGPVLSFRPADVHCTYWSGQFPVELQGTMLGSGGRIFPYVQALWGVYGPPISAGLSGVFKRAGSSTILTGGPSGQIQLLPMTSVPGEDPTRNITRTVTRLTFP
jgi:hypothetical protein